MPNTLDAEQAQRINRVQIALLLHKTPEEVDRMPLRDVCDIMEVKRGENMIADFEASKARAKANMKRRRR